MIVRVGRGQNKTLKMSIRIFHDFKNMNQRKGLVISNKNRFVKNIRYICHTFKCSGTFLRFTLPTNQYRSCHINKISHDHNWKWFMTGSSVNIHYVVSEVTDESFQASWGSSAIRKSLWELEEMVSIVWLIFGSAGKDWRKWQSSCWVQFWFIQSSKKRWR